MVWAGWSCDPESFIISRDIHRLIKTQQWSCEDSWHRECDQKDPYQRARGTVYMCVYVSLCVCVCAFLCLCVDECPCTCHLCMCVLCVHMPISVCKRVCVCVCVGASAWAYLHFYHLALSLGPGFLSDQPHTVLQTSHITLCNGHSHSTHIQ